MSINYNRRVIFFLVKKNRSTPDSGDGFFISAAGPLLKYDFNKAMLIAKIRM